MRWLFSKINLLPPKEQLIFFDIFRKYPELIHEAEERLKKKVEILTDGDEVRLRELLASELVYMQGYFDRLAIDIAKKDL